MELDRLMSKKDKHVLLWDDLESAFDEAEGLATMEAMAEEAGDWRGHVPYAAMRRYRDESKVRTQYESHVDECSYCRRMIDALHPTEEIVDDFQTLVRRMSDRGYYPELEGVIERFVEHMWTTPRVGILSGEFLQDPSCLLAWEATGDVMSKFKAARIYLGTSRSWLAYERIGEGCALAEVDSEVIERVNAVAQHWNGTPQLATESARKLMMLYQAGLDDEIDQLELFGVLGELGQHGMALKSLRNVLMCRDGTDEVVEALENAELVAQSGTGEVRKSWLAAGMRAGNQQQ